ncbi:uncharacterized protein BDR25DRAFT_296755 [Lindgomyces ingoldianus]|uniref:Uncharacterized protein n=1 Tax=Lindgomyces ingoldianus TaxID=673940 RepID=A0ACB6QCC7_9PLEO|nr:uncharacterized protein BDR25DRAFT_296755 [Lindgomyces ingoldianus]KAF2464505.1 hypothetical protein BDR25DRAFT_296755 [Lindgomyces ingoldianus]
MSPAPIIQGVPTLASPPQPPHSPIKENFDEIFHAKFMQIIQQYRDNPRTGSLTQKDRKQFIDSAYHATDELYFGNRKLDDTEIKLRALTKVFYKVLADEPWSEEWIRPHDVERKLSRFEMHPDSRELAAQNGVHTPREAVIAARRALIATQSPSPGHGPQPRGPFDDIEIIYIPGTVSSTATNKIDRMQIYPVSVSSVAHILQTHICRDMTRPYLMAQKFVHCTDTLELIKMRQFACDVCDFAPHLLDNDNISLLIVLLILTRSEICKRFEENGIRIEGSTISHRRAECMKQKLGWKELADRKPFDNVAADFQTRVKNACFPAPRARVTRSKPQRKSSAHSMHVGLMGPPIGPPKHHSPYPQHGSIKNGPNVPTFPTQQANFLNLLHQPSHTPAAPKSRPGSTPNDPMDLS